MQGYNVNIWFVSDKIQLWVKGQYICQLKSDLENEYLDIYVQHQHHNIFWSK